MLIVMRAVAAATVAAVLTLSACGSGETTSPSQDSSSTRQPAVTQAVEPQPAEPTTATEVAEAIKAEITEISKVVTITEDNDPNDKIGRPGGYVDGAVLFDSRAEPLDEDPGVDQGAFLEVWPDGAAASDRSEYIQTVLEEAGGVLGTEYHYLQDRFLLRVSGVIKPSQAEAYETAFNAQF